MSEADTPQIKLTKLREFESATSHLHVDEPSEIVIALVGPLGTNNQKVCQMVSERLKEFGYSTEEIRISRDVIPLFVDDRDMPPASGAYEEAENLILLGNEIRRKTKIKEILAIAAAAAIAQRRPEGDIRKQAYIVSSLKNRQELEQLKRIYGKGFYVFAVYTERESRASYLSHRGMSSDLAWKLILKDEDEPDDFGQHTRDTFHLADFFVADEKNDDKLRSSICRCLDLIFSHPNITPTFNEFAMFMAFASSLRSADLSRQVGAVVTKGREILSTGANDCPSPGGGLYWPEFIGNRVDDLPRGRDYKRGADSNAIEKERIFESIIREVSEEYREDIRAVLSRSPLKDITEFGRVVHAEMEALLACARSNTSCVGGVMYCTTFPCHNCAKHIIAAGIEQVIYVEPYPKSKALEFHDDAITTGKIEHGEQKIRFKPFIGVGPRQFFDLFSLALGVGRKIERKNKSHAAKWSPISAVPRVSMVPVDYLDYERRMAEYLDMILKSEDQRNGDESESESEA